MVEVGGKIHRNVKVHKSYVYIDEKFVILPLYIHRFHVPVLHILLTKKDTVFIQQLLNGNIYALKYFSNCNDIH